MTRIILTLLLFALSLLAQSTRTWTDTDGRSLEATLVRVDDARYYIDGVSGSHISSTLIVYLRPEHFRGAINVVRGALLEPYTLKNEIAGAVNYKAGTTYPPFLPHLKGKHVRISQRYQDKRWAFVAGEKDENYECAKVPVVQ